MSTLAYTVAYLGILTFFLIIAAKTIGYLKRPLHVRWELYPVAHEEPSRAAYGGSYLEDSGWWRKKQKASLWGSIKGIVVEFSVLHSTWCNNRPLWLRTYPFHLGLYLLVCSMGLAAFAAILLMCGVSGVFMRLVFGLGNVSSIAAFCLTAFGAAALLHRRLSQEDLRNYSTPEHFFNLGAFLLLALLGIANWASALNFFGQLTLFAHGLLTFSFAPLPGALFPLLIIVMFALMAYVPSTHMAHFFMKYFLYHDIRWGDQPTQDNPATQQKINAVLGYRVAWKAGHIGSDGSRTWAEVATTNPTAPKE